MSTANDARLALLARLPILVDDELATLHTVADFVAALQTCSDVPAFLRAAAAALGIRVLFETGTVHVRAILSDAANRGMRRRDAAAAELFYACNGLVIDVAARTILVHPPRAFNRHPDAATVDAALAAHRYDILPITDGTVVVLYYWPPVDTWCIATANGYDVSTLQWMGARSYAQLLHSLMVQLCPVFADRTGLSIEDGRLHFNTLDRTKQYILGFRHHDFHPMHSDPERIWRIASHEDADGLQDLHDIPAQLVLNPAPFASLQAARAACSGALQTSAASGGVPNYGYILRARAVAPRSTPDVLIESPLLEYLRTRVYDKCGRLHDVAPEARFELHAMRAYLASAATRSSFVAIFPRYNAIFRRYDDFIHNLSMLVAVLLRQKAMAPLAREAVYASPIGRIATTFAEHIGSSEHIVSGRDVDSIIRDFATNPEYALIYLRAQQ
jgi:hypothetical protein